jgi:hypothetical protein
MANEPNTKDELLAYEDTFHQFSAEFRRMREAMIANNVDSVDLHTGTLRYHLIKISETIDKLSDSFNRKILPNKVRTRLAPAKKPNKTRKKE